MTTVGEPSVDPTSSVTLDPSTNLNNGGSETLNIVAIVAPIVLAAGLVIWGFLVLFGVVQCRRHPRSAPSTLHTSRREKARPLKVPKLFEVQLPCTSNYVHRKEDVCVSAALLALFSLINGSLASSCGVYQARLSIITPGSFLHL